MVDVFIGKLVFLASVIVYLSFGASLNCRFIPPFQSLCLFVVVLCYITFLLRNGE